jgi:6-phosphogluconolactonase
MNSRAAPVLETFATREALYDAAARGLGAALIDAVAAHGLTGFAATGGTTPAPVYDRLAQMAAPWERITVTLTDERWVAPTAPGSNEGLVRRHLLTGQAAKARFAPLWSDVDGPEKAARLAEASLATVAPFGAVLLGVGADGHFASLFPGSPALAEGLDPQSERLCLAVPPGDPAPDMARISLTLKALTQSAMILLLITGTEKRLLLEGPVDPALPIAAILEQDRVPVRILWAE